MNSMHKTGVGFRDVEESVQRLEDIKWSSKVSKGGGGVINIILQAEQKLPPGT